jgi:hypothetical protein
VRYLVHQYIVKKLERDISPLEWLLFQLFPEKFLGGDVFRYIFSDCIYSADTDINGTSCMALITVEFQTRVVSFIDEGQQLLNQCQDAFLSMDGTRK